MTLWGLGNIILIVVVVPVLAVIRDQVLIHILLLENLWPPQMLI